ncbi:MAG: hypothetical protein U0325_35315 [Polyangiales bacterium]
MAVPRKWVILPLIAVSGPLSLGVETAVRLALFTPDMVFLRAQARPLLTPFAWGLAAVTVLGGAAAVPVQRAWYRRRLASMGVEGETPEGRARAAFEALYVATSVPQVPALVVTLCFTAGSALLPVAVALGVSAAAVLALGLVRLDGA